MSVRTPADAGHAPNANLVNPLASANLASSSFLYAELSQALLNWYDASGRDLPWRRTQDAYAIWISEIMLQQTQVKTVLPYYDRWLQQFPDVQTLAATAQQTVLKAWEGLGYYARARNLHRASQMIVERFNGEFPNNFDDAMSLPGIGRTTAGGILSSAFNLPLPIMDGNVKRVLARLIGLTVPPAKALDQLWEISAQLVPTDNGRDFNQAFMDLGATICTPKNPACLLCPWRTSCQAYQHNQQTQLPISERKKSLPHKTIGVVMITNNQGEILINQRPEQGLLGGLWEFPSLEVPSGRSTLNAIKKTIPQNFGIRFKLPTAIIQIEHTYTHFKATFHVYQADLDIETETHRQTANSNGAAIEQRWIKLNQLDQFPFPKSHLKMIQAFRATMLPRD
ncbi:A/G-specific adenine glycosylase [filamentous cyanobacterium LEGE 11480]|uniref:Adenine DNA glycosylase n=1 Tax=Romeriopsis navalis LEGE 11480 TaxID=2777977 RepID=A0A928VST4_9CYAN|nr:A/G-specific adenine glycosylase [Romeriopsis navalis]MBE9031574.1 A/G-specific adenine glycosylase [Romeriopsis navalis LEGE 11480]